VEKEFAWHQPEYTIGFDYTVSATKPGELAQVKPLEMPYSKMTEGKHIIRYVIDRAGHFPATDVSPSEESATRENLVAGRH
jgi:hypothetical protein